MKDAFRIIRYVIAIVAALTVGGLSQVSAREGKIITMGQTQSPVLKNIVAIREKKGAKALIQSIRAKLPLPNDGNKEAETMRRKAEMDAIGHTLRKVDAVVVDLAEVTPTPDGILVAKAAIKAGVPIVMENVSGEKMVALVGTGTDADLVVAWSKAKGGPIQLTLWSDEPGVHGNPGSETKNYIRDPKGFKQVIAEVEAILEQRSF
ncbi:MAG: hypothetical protein V3V31_15050 [Methylococcales bacterium]